MRLIQSMLLFLVLAGTGITATAQSSVAEQVKEWERAKKYTQAYLDAMPDSGYALKPTPEMRSFAQQMLHLADANYAFISSASGAANPMKMGEAEKTTDQSKANVTKLVLASYDYAIMNIGKMTDAKLKEKIKVFGQFDMTRGEAISKDFEHQTHHRGQTTVYIRLAGATPPQEMLF